MMARAVRMGLPTSGSGEPAVVSDGNGSWPVNGRTHISNSVDISVPVALRPVIAGLPTLNDFFKTSDFHATGTVAERAAAAARNLAASNAGGAVEPLGKAYLLDPSRVPFDAPDYTNGTTHFVGAGDFAAI
jgi:hypothetical protein